MTMTSIERYWHDDITDLAIVEDTRFIAHPYIAESRRFVELHSESGVWGVPENGRLEIVAL